MVFLLTEALYYDVSMNEDMSVRRTNVLLRSNNPRVTHPPFFFFVQPLIATVACYDPAMMTLICTSDATLRQISGVDYWDADSK